MPTFKSIAAETARAVGVQVVPDIDKIKARNKARKSADVRQYGCDGRHHGKGTPDCPTKLHHHHDESCETPPQKDIDDLLAEVDRLSIQSAGYDQHRQRLYAFVRKIAATLPSEQQTEALDVLTRVGTPTGELMKL
jgi:hypothetical protein